MAFAATITLVVDLLAAWWQIIRLFADILPSATDEVYQIIQFFQLLGFLYFAVLATMGCLVGFFCVREAVSNVIVIGTECGVESVGGFPLSSERWRFYMEVCENKVSSCIRLSRRLYERESEWRDQFAD